MRRLVNFKSVGTAWVVLFCLTLVSCREAKPMMVNNEYKIMDITLSDKELSSSYSATITGRQSVEIRPQVSGLITEVCIAEGATVRKGQTLFIIDQVPYKAALQTADANVASAEAGVATAKLTADSKKVLFDQNVVSTYDLQMAQNSLLVQQAALSQAAAQQTNARNNLSYTVVKSPVDGVAGMITYRVGALVSPTIATPLVTVSDDAQMYVYFSMTENQVLDLAKQSGSVPEAMRTMPEVQLRLSDGSIYAHKGKIDAISGLIDPTTGSVSVRATFPNSNRILLTGGAGNVIFPYEKKGCIVIPQAATYEIQDRIFVYKVVDGKAKSSPVTAFRINDGSQYIIESGLEVGDRIVAEGAGLVRDGAEIKEKTSEKAAN